MSRLASPPGPLQGESSASLGERSSDPLPLGQALDDGASHDIPSDELASRKSAGDYDNSLTCEDSSQVGGRENVMYTFTS